MPDREPAGKELQLSESAGSGAGEQLPLVVRSRALTAERRVLPSVMGRALRRLRFLPLILVFLAVSGVVALYFQPPGLKMLMSVLDLEPGGGTRSPIAVPATPVPEIAGAPGDEERKIVGLGILLPEGDLRTVAPPFGAGDARVTDLRVEEGDRVDAGEVLATLDNASDIEARIENAEATVSARRATLAQVKSSVLASRDETRASLSRARSALENAEADFGRTETLFNRGFTTRAILDQKRAARDQAEGEVTRLGATLARFSAETADEQPDVIVAARNLDAAISDLNRARGDLDKSVVRAPVDGTILKIHIRPGERPGSEGILDLGNIDRMTAEIEVYQTEIGRVTIDAPVELTAEALPVKLAGTVSRIGMEVGRQTLVDSSPAANTDARVVTVTVELDEPSSRAAQRFTNLQVLARIAVPAS